MAKFSPLMAAGWEVIPLARDGAKRPLVSGYHGAAHEVADKETVKGWAKQFPECNPAIVLPPGVVGFDVDHHDADGLLALDAFEREYGELPEGPRIFHGYTVDDVPSPYGTMLFAVPPEVLDRFGPKMVVGNLNKVTGLPGVDVIAPWLRYNVAPGAVHKSGETYEWAIGSHRVNGDMPKPTDLPMLTVRQAEALLTRRAKKIEAAEPPKTPAGRGNALLAQVGELALLDEGETLLIEGQERGWQRGDGFYVLACALLRVCEETGKDPEVIKARFVKAAHAGGRGLDEEEAERQWENAAESVEEEREQDEEVAYRCAPMALPMKFTREYLARHHTTDEGVLRLRFNDGTFWLWEGSHYRPLTEKEVRAILANDLEDAIYRTPDGPELVNPRTPVLAELFNRLVDTTLVSRHGAGELLPSTGGVPFRNGWLNVVTGELEPLGPQRDVRWVVPAEYDPDAECPEWFRFLDSIGWTEGTDHRRLIRQWLGWLISGDTSIHKGALLVGPKRAGKGTVLAVSEALMGDGAVGIQLGDFARNFGLAPIIGKGLVTIGDARFAFRTDKGMVERLLSLTSFDPLNIDVKNKDGFQGRPTARLMIASNETPKFIEASDALASRFLIFEFVESFYGREDLGLTRRIVAELPGIAHWALGGYDEVREQGFFSETEAGLRLQEQIIRDAAPIRQFVEEECDLGPDLWVESQELYDAYGLWAERNGVYRVDKMGFYRDLNTAYPGAVGNLKKRIGTKRVPCKTGIALS